MPLWQIIDSRLGADNYSYAGYYIADNRLCHAYNLVCLYIEGN